MEWEQTHSRSVIVITTLSGEVVWLGDTFKSQSVIVLVILQETNHKWPGEQKEQEMNATKYGLGPEGQLR